VVQNPSKPQLPRYNLIVCDSSVWRCFYVGPKVVRKDRKAPFVHTQTVSAGATAGSTVSVRARAFIKVKRGRGPKKSISTTVRVCS